MATRSDSMKWVRLCYVIFRLNGNFRKIKDGSHLERHHCGWLHVLKKPENTPTINWCTKLCRLRAKWNLNRLKTKKLFTNFLQCTKFQDLVGQQGVPTCNERFVRFLTFFPMKKFGPLPDRWTCTVWLWSTTVQGTAQESRGVLYGFPDG